MRMTNWLLLFFLLLITWLCYCLSDGCLLSPAFIVSAVMALTSLLLAINTDYWGYEISLNTVMCIVLSVLAFGVGEFFSFRSKKVVILDTARYLDNYQVATISKSVYVLLAVVSVGMFLIYFYTQLHNASKIGMEDSLSNIIIANRWYVEEKENETIVKFIFRVHRVIVFSVIFNYLYKLIIEKRNKNLFATIVISIPFFCSCVLSSNRSDLIYAASYLIFLILFLHYRSNGWQMQKSNTKMVRIIILIFIIALILFRLLGYLTGKSVTTTAYDNITAYMGSSFICFDKYLLNNGADFPASDTPLLFRGIYSIINMFGFNLDAHSFFKPHQHWGIWGSNVYSSLLEYHLKFGMVGLLIMEILIGAFYGTIWKKIKSGIASWNLVIVYAELFFCYLCMYSLDERFFCQFFTLTSFVEVFFICIITNKMMVYKNEE